MNYFGLLLGHMVGDYLFQNDWMALSKNRIALKGWFTCLVHCVLYTIGVMLFTFWSWKWAAIIFLSHFVIDKFSVAEYYARLIKGRSIKTYLETEYSPIKQEHAEDSFNKHILSGGFASFVYIARDNTMHLLLMFLGYKYLLS